MRTLPATMIWLLVPFAPLFSKRVWQNAQVLLIGVILAPGVRTVSSAPTRDGIGDWTNTNASIATTGCSVTLAGRA